MNSEHRDLAGVDAGTISPEVRTAVNSALTVKLKPGESLPFTVRVCSDEASATWMAQHGQVPSGSVLYIPAAGEAHVTDRHAPGGYESPGPGTPAEETRYPGSHRVAAALRKRGPIAAPDPQEPPKASLAARLAVMASPADATWKPQQPARPGHGKQGKTAGRAAAPRSVR